MAFRSRIIASICSLLALTFSLSSCKSDDNRKAEAAKAQSEKVAIPGSESAAAADLSQEAAKDALPETAPEPQPKLADDEAQWEAYAESLQRCPGGPPTASGGLGAPLVPAEVPDSALLDKSLIGSLAGLSKTLWQHRPGFVVIPRSGMLVASALDASFMVGGLEFALERTLSGPTKPGELPGGGWNYGYGPGSPLCGNPGVGCDSLGRVRAMAWGESLLEFRWQDGRLLWLGESTGTGVTFEFAGDGTLAAAKLPGGTSVKYSFGPAGLISAVAAPLGHKQYEYGQGGRLAAAASGEMKTIITYDDRGRVNYIASFAGSSQSPEPLKAGDVATIAYKEASDNNITEIMSTHNGKVAFAYSKDGKSIGVTDQNGLVTTKLLDDKGRVKELSKPGGGTLRIVWNADGTPGMVVLPGGAMRQYEYGPSGLTSVGDGVRKATLTYGESGRLERFNDEQGRVWAWKRNECGAVVSRSFPTGRELTYGYDDKGRLVSVTDPSGKGQRRKFDEAGRVVELQEDEVGSWRFTYNERGDLVARLDPEGRKSAFAWDEKGLLLELLDPMGRKTVNKYDYEGRVIESVRDGVTLFQAEYDGVGRPVWATSVGEKSNYSWRPDGLLEGLVDGGGIQWSYEYDSLGRLARVARGGTSVWQGTWTIAGLLASEVGEDGVTRKYEYDDLGRLTKESDGASWRAVKWGDGGTAEVSHSDGTWALLQPVGIGEELRVVEEASAAGERRLYSWTNQGLLAGTRGAGSGSVKYGYDALGRVKWVESGVGGRSDYQWDGAGRLVEAKHVSGLVRKMEYDVNGHLAAAEVGMARYLLKWDEDGRLLELKDPMGGKARFTYDEKGRLTGGTGLDGVSYEARLDDRGRTLFWRRGTGAEERYSYDRGGRLGELRAGAVLMRGLVYNEYGATISDTGPDHATHYTWDSQGRLVSVSDGRTKAKLDFMRDAAGRLSQIVGLGRTLSSFQYGTDGKLDTLNGPEKFEVKYSFDDSGRVVQRTLHGGVEVKLAYDKGGRLESERWQRADGAAIFLLRYQYDEAGRLLRKSVDGQAHEYSYDDSGRLASAVLPSGEKVRLEYDAAGGVTKLGTNKLLRDKGQRVIEGLNLTWKYDDSGRLSELSSAGARLRLERDPLGRLSRLVAIPKGGAADSSGAAAGPLPASAAGAPAIPAEAKTTPWHEGGSKGVVAAFRYDGEGNLVQYEGEAGEVSFVTIRGRVFAEMEGGKTVRTYIYEPYGDHALGFTQDRKSYYYVRDRQGTVLAVVDEEGRVVNRYGYDLFGSVTRREEGVRNYFGFSGRFTEPVTGFTHYPARWAAPDAATWLSPDPHPGQLAFPETWHRYAMFENDPINNVDPIGTSAFEWQAGATTLENVCGLFQQGKIQATQAFGNTLDGYKYVGAIDKGGWVHDVWVKNVPGTNRVMTIFRDLNEKAHGYYGKPNFTGNMMVPQGAPATQGAQSATANSGGSLGQSVRSGYEMLKAGASNYGKEVTTTVAGLGGVSGTLGTSVTTLAALPGGGLIIGTGIAVAAGGGVLIGTGLNQIPAVQNGAQALIGKATGYSEPQDLVDAKKELELKGPKMIEKDNQKIKEFLAKVEASGLPEATEPGVAEGTPDLGATPPGGGSRGKATKGGSADLPHGNVVAQGEETEETEETEDKSDEEGEETPEQPDDEPEEEPAAESKEEPDPSDESVEIPDQMPRGLEDVVPVRISIAFKHDVDASHKEYRNIVTCQGTLNFWNVGSLVPGMGGVTMPVRCRASINGSEDSFTNYGTFSGGPNGTFVVEGEHSSGTFRMNGGASVTMPGMGTFGNPNPGAFENWPK